MPKLRLTSKFARKMASGGFLRIILSTLNPYDVSATHEARKLALGVPFVQIMRVTFSLDERTDGHFQYHFDP